MRSAVPPAKIRKTARQLQVDSDGYKGDEEDDDYGVSVESDAAAGSGQTTGATSSADADIEAYVAAYMCEEDLVFIKSLSKGMRTNCPVKGCTGISTTIAACESTPTTPASVSDVMNTRGIRHPSDALLPNTISPRNARDPSPTYNQNTQNSQSPNPMYLPKAQKQQPDSLPEPTLDSDNPCIQPEAASFQEDDQTTSGPAVGDDDPFSQPYAVRYKEEDEGVGITPYAVAYMCQDDTDNTDQTDTKTPSSSNNDTDNTLNQNPMFVQNTLNPNPMCAQNALNPNPMYGQNALNPNPVPKVVQEAGCVCTSRWVCAAVTAAVILVLLILVGTLAGLYLNTREQPTQPVDTTNTTESYTGHVKSTPIVFGGEGSSPGQISDPNGVAVSADNEIYVVDLNNKRVQVFSMNGTFLRLFPPEVPGGNGQAMPMYPTDVDIDDEGHIWVVGKNFPTSGAVHVVQYGLNGIPVTTFGVQRSDWFPVIAVNSRYNRIIVVAHYEVLKFKPNGSFDGSFVKEEGAELRYGRHHITSDRDGNILVTDTSLPGVKVYDHNGQRLFSFRTVSVGKGKPRGICMDPQGHIMVADSGNGRVDMFTSRGKFVRTVVNVTNPWGIALGPGGQLVVTDVSNYIVTIFPRWMVFPDE
ncbi:PREDICTED: protein wech-like [Branchiostoma belcheri]|uniref:Protein wech-like n=1 Tax=Branchiostoma belcheri TaxID=7741 RepID=A0A6P4Z109_BRABE|nr:PREDICTED: protein wech-like [Branchiostoma belcheri]